jgi:hypothetical protein
LKANSRSFNVLEGWPGIDLRSLALMRIACALLCLFDLGNRAFALRAQYTSQGVLALRNYLWQPDLSWRVWSIYYLGDSPFFVCCMFGLTATLAVSLALGYRSRAASLGLWIMILSLHHRNILVINGGDHYFRMLLFWGIFLPWGARFSLDRVAAERAGIPAQETTVLPAGLGYLGQVCYVYWFNALYKTGPSWKIQGTATYDALQIAEIGNGLGRLLMGFGTLLKPLTLGVWYVELLTPFLLLLPFSRLRLLGLAILAALHLGILATMRVEIFSLVALVALSGLLPAYAWSLRPGRALESRLESAYSRILQSRPGLAPPVAPTQPRNKAETFLLLLAILFVTLQSPHDYLSEDSWQARWGYGRAAGLYVKWAMFSPGPPADSWQSAPAETISGRPVDLLTGQPPSRNKLQTTSRYRPFGRWKSYRSSIKAGGFGSNAQAYLDFLVADWNLENPEDPVSRAAYVANQETEPVGYRLPRVKTQTYALYTRPEDRQ